MSDGAIYQVKTAFVVSGRVLRVGETIREGHPLLVAYPDKFKPLEVRYEHGVEQATAAPGEKRSTSSKPDAAKSKGEEA